MIALSQKPLGLLLLLAVITPQFTSSIAAQSSPNAIEGTVEGARTLREQCPNTALQTAKIVAINKNAEIILEDGRRLKFANIFFQKSATNDAVPEQTIQFLKSHLADKTISFLQTSKRDRHQRISAHIIANSPGQNNENTSEEWFQPHIIKAGIGLFMPEPYKKPQKAFCNNDRLKQALQRYDQPEINTQSRSRLTPIYASSSSALWQLKGHFAIVEGVVLKTHSSGKNIFLNFGAEWKSDFTAVISKNNKEALQKHFKSISNLEGKQVRLRGFLDLYNGPNMRIDHPLQIEILHE